MRARWWLLSCGLALCACSHATTQVWRRPDGIHVAMLESGTIDGPSGIQPAGKDTLILFRRRKLLLRGVEQFEGTVSTHRIELQSGALSLTLDEGHLRIRDRRGERSTNILVALSQIPPNETSVYAGGTLTMGPGATAEPSAK